MASSELSRDELAAAVSARAELGREYEPAVIDGLADRIERVVQGRVTERLAARAAGQSEALKVAGWSLLAGIPITGITADKGTAMVAIAWGGIAAINLAHSLTFRRRRD